MLVTQFNEQFPYITLEEVYDEEELSIIWEELNFLCYKKNFLPPEESGTAKENGEILKRNNCIWLDKFYSDRKHSNILHINKKIIDHNIQDTIFKNNPSWFFQSIDIGSYHTLLSYYESGDYYKPHKDSSLVTCVTWFYKEPKKFDGGNFLLYLNDEAFFIEVKNNMAVIFPSCITHSVTEIKMDQDYCNNKNGRFCMTQFLHAA